MTSLPCLLHYLSGHSVLTALSWSETGRPGQTTTLRYNLPVLPVRTTIYVVFSCHCKYGSQKATVVPRTLLCIIGWPHQLFQPPLIYCVTISYWPGELNTLHCVRGAILFFLFVVLAFNFIFNGVGFPVLVEVNVIIHDVLNFSRFSNTLLQYPLNWVLRLFIFCKLVIMHSSHQIQSVQIASYLSLITVLNSSNVWWFTITVSWSQFNPVRTTMK